MADDEQRAKGQRIAQLTRRLLERRGLLVQDEGGTELDTEELARALAEAFGTDDAVEIVERCRQRGMPP
jgi:hypothetical protein